MKAQIDDTSRVAKTQTDIRTLNLSEEGQGRAFPKVPNLPQYASTRTFYGRAKVDGKIYRESPIQPL